jgi:hypothetical protein
MKLTIVAECEEEFDGYTGVLTLSRDNVETLHDLAFFFESASTAIGFTYVDNVGISKSLSKGKSEIIWSSF